MPQTETWTIKRLLEWTTEYFGRHDSDSPRLEAEILLAAALGCERIQLYTRFADVPEERNLTCRQRETRQDRPTMTVFAEMS